MSAVVQLERLAFKDFAPSFGPPQKRASEPELHVVFEEKRGRFDGLAHRDFAPRVTPAIPPAPEPARQIQAPVDHFSRLVHRDFAPAVRRIVLYYDPNSPLDPDWRPKAVCRGKGDTPEGMKMWFPGRGGAHTGKTFCRVCPVQRECAKEAADNGEEWGIWGGEIMRRN